MRGFSGCSWAMPVNGLWDMGLASHCTPTGTSHLSLHRSDLRIQRSSWSASEIKAAGDLRTRTQGGGCGFARFTIKKERLWTDKMVLVATNWTNIIKKSTWSTFHPDDIQRKSWRVWFMKCQFSSKNKRLPRPRTKWSCSYETKWAWQKYEKYI